MTTKAHLVWGQQRVTALSLIILIPLLGIILFLHRSVSYSEWLNLFSNPFINFLFGGTFYLIFLHGSYGMQVMIEDYISNNFSRKILIRALWFKMRLIGFLIIGLMIRLLIKCS